MDINVAFLKGEWSVRPERAEVRVGEPVTWVVRAARFPLHRLRWTIYFDHGAPFMMRPSVLVPMDSPPFSASLRFSVSVTTLNTGIGSYLEQDPILARQLQKALDKSQEIADHQGVTEPITPERPGEYKYGVKLEDAESGELISNDDPFLVVR